MSSIDHYLDKWPIGKPDIKNPEAINILALEGLIEEVIQDVNHDLNEDRAIGTIRECAQFIELLFDEDFSENRPSAN